MRPGTRASAYAAREPSRVESSTAPTDVTTLLRTYRRNTGVMTPA